MRKIQNYQVVTADSAELLTSLVGSEMIAGWQPVGSHQVAMGSYETPDSSFAVWSQTMVIYDSERN